MLLKVSLMMTLCALLYAQEFRSTLSGRVTDPSGASIPNAKVIATEANTGAKAEVNTSPDGEFSLPFLAPGPSKLSVEAQGFKKYTPSGITIGTNVRLTQDVTLQVG
ncbi:MAG: carboxypeptidase-like regulatory domain-containing protein, partial [Acidobacteria bacterium]|nr:carboxypeptidase-like regulatory domain-containing protein [Acidobacteriota bacterium]